MKRDLSDKFQVLSLVINSHGYIFAGMGILTLEPDGIVLRSSDSGNTWAASGLDRCQVYCLATNAAGHIFAGIDYWFVNIPQGIYRSTDDGASWTSIGGTIYVVLALAVSPSGYLFANASGRVVRSLDDGVTWTATGLEEYWLKCLAVNSRGDLLAGGGKGVVWSSDNGDTWTTAGQGMDSVDVESIAFDSAGRVYAGATDGFVYQTTLSTVSVKNIPSRVAASLALFQNYPNPFNPSTTIKYNLPKSSVVSLAVFDILGREVSMLVNERRDAGVYEVRFDGSNLASGVYFYRLQAGNYVATKPLLLLK